MNRWVLAGIVVATLITGALLLVSGPSMRSPIPFTPADATRAEDLPTVASMAEDPQREHLGAQLDRVDPARDGWDSEAFNEEAEAQLKKLGELLADPQALDAETQGALITEDFNSGPLRPASLEEVFADRCLVVTRGSTGSLESALSLPQALAELRAPYADAPDIRVKFKIISVTRAGESIETRAYFQASGRPASGAVQQGAVWHCTWNRANSANAPRLAQLRIEDFEEITNRQGRDRWFSDCTLAILENNSSYRDHLRYGIDHWRRRIDGNLGIHVLGHHGMALGDVNGDGLDDFYVCQPGGIPNRLFVQNADGTARDVSAEAGVDWLENTISALILDIDNDDDQDLIIGFSWGLLFMANDGTGHFTRASEKVMVSYPMSLSAADYDQDGDLDIYACVYAPEIRMGAAGAEMVGGAMRLGPWPYFDANNGGRNLLFRNNGNWRFSDATAGAGLDENNSRFSFAASWEDFDNDGDQDLCVANDFGRKNLYRNDNGVFRDVAPQAGAEDIGAGMSVSWADFNQDGLMDVYMGNMFSSAGNRITTQPQFGNGQVPEAERTLYQRHARGNTLLQNLGEGRFGDVSVEAAVTLGRWAWSSPFLDINNDGREDIFVANGYVTQHDTGDL